VAAPAATKVDKDLDYSLVTSVLSRFWL